MAVKSRKKYGNGGFTLVETCVAVAIMAILLFIGFAEISKHQRELKVQEMDNLAREAYMAAENQALSLSRAGKLVKAVSEAGGKFLYGIEIKDKNGSSYNYYENDSVGKMIVDNFDADALDGPALVYVPAGTGKVSGSSLMDEGTVDPKVSGGCVYLIYDLFSGAVVDAYFSEEDMSVAEGSWGNFATMLGVSSDLPNILKNGWEIINKEPKPQNAKSVAERANKRAFIGRYDGGISAVRNSAPDTAGNVDVNIYNGADLYVEITYPADSKLEIKVLYKTGVMNLTDENLTDKSAFFGVTRGRFYLDGDPSRRDGIQKIRFGSGKPAGTTLTCVDEWKKSDGTKITFSNNIDGLFTVEVNTVRGGYRDGDTVVKQGQPLFADGSAPDTAVITSLRHLQNLDQKFSGTAGVTTAVQKADIDCKGLKDTGDELTGGYGFESIYNDKLRRFSVVEKSGGEYYIIKNLKVTEAREDVTDHIPAAGLFSSTWYDDLSAPAEEMKVFKFEHVTVNNAMVDVAGARFAGVVCGRLYRTQFINCEVSGKIIVRAESYAGGVAGECSAPDASGVTVKISSGSVINATAGAGGIFGHVYIDPGDYGSETTKLNNCEVSGTGTSSVIGDTGTWQAGGLIGDVGGTFSVLACNIKNLEVSGNNAGGAIGAATGIEKVTGYTWDSTDDNIVKVKDINASIGGITVDGVIIDKGVNSAGGIVGYITGYPSGMVMKNSSCKNSTIGTGDTYLNAGGIVGTATHRFNLTTNEFESPMHSLFENCDVTNTNIVARTNTSERGSAGGVAGYVSDAVFKDCDVSSSAGTKSVKGLSYVGGIAGRTDIGFAERHDMSPVVVYASYGNADSDSDGEYDDDIKISTNCSIFLNCTVKNIEVKSDYTSHTIKGGVGGIVGYSDLESNNNAVKDKNTLVSKCKVIDTQVSGVYTYSYPVLHAGGIAGYADRLEVVTDGAGKTEISGVRKIEAQGAAGGIAGYVKYAKNITGCNLSDIEIKSRFLEAGGFFGYVGGNVTFDRCGISNADIEGHTAVGGFAGKAVVDASVSGAAINVINSYSSVVAKITQSGWVYVGGFIGENNGKLNINNSYSGSILYGGGGFTGGFVGYTNNIISIDKAYVAGAIHGDRITGICYNSSNGNSVKNMYVVAPGVSASSGTLTSFKLIQDTESNCMLGDNSFSNVFWLSYVADGNDAWQTFKETEPGKTRVHGYNNNTYRKWGGSDWSWAADALYPSYDGADGIIKAVDIATPPSADMFGGGFIKVENDLSGSFVTSSAPTTRPATHFRLFTDGDSCIDDGNNGKYPYPMLSGMDFYGDWRTAKNHNAIDTINIKDKKPADLFDTDIWIRALKKDDKTLDDKALGWISKKLIDATSGGKMFTYNEKSYKVFYAKKLSFFKNGENEDYSRVSLELVAEESGVGANRFVNVNFTYDGSGDGGLRTEASMAMAMEMLEKAVFEGVQRSEGDSDEAYKGKLIDKVEAKLQECNLNAGVPVTAETGALTDGWSDYEDVFEVDRTGAVLKAKEDDKWKLELTFTLKKKEASMEPGESKEVTVVFSKHILDVINEMTEKTDWTTLADITEIKEVSKTEGGYDYEYSYDDSPTNYSPTYSPADDPTDDSVKYNYYELAKEATEWLKSQGYDNYKVDKVDKAEGTEITAFQNDGKYAKAEFVLKKLVGESWNVYKNSAGETVSLALKTGRRVAPDVVIRAMVEKTNWNLRANATKIGIDDNGGDQYDTNPAELATEATEWLTSLGFGNYKVEWKGGAFRTSDDGYATADFVLSSYKEFEGWVQYKNDKEEPVTFELKTGRKVEPAVVKRAITENAEKTGWTSKAILTKIGADKTGDEYDPKSPETLATEVTEWLKSLGFGNYEVSWKDATFRTLDDDMFAEAIFKLCRGSEVCKDGAGRDIEFTLKTSHREAGPSAVLEYLKSLGKTWKLPDGSGVFVHVVQTGGKLSLTQESSDKDDFKKAVDAAIENLRNNRSKLGLDGYTSEVSGLQIKNAEGDMVEALMTVVVKKAGSNDATEKLKADIKIVSFEDYAKAQLNNEQYKDNEGNEGILNLISTDSDPLSGIKEWAKKKIGDADVTVSVNKIVLEGEDGTVTRAVLKEGEVDIVSAKILMTLTVNGTGSESADVAVRAKMRNFVADVVKGVTLPEEKHENFEDVKSQVTKSVESTQVTVSSIEEKEDGSGYLVEFKAKTEPFGINFTGLELLDYPVEQNYKTVTPTPSPTVVPTGTETSSPTDAATGTGTPTPSPTDAAAGTETPTPSSTDAIAGTGTSSPTETPAETGAPTPSPTDAPAETGTPTPSPTDVAAGTGAPIPSSTDAIAGTGTSSPTETPAGTETPNPTEAPAEAPAGTEADSAEALSETETEKTSDSNIMSLATAGTSILAGLGLGLLKMLKILNT